MSWDVPRTSTKIFQSHTNLELLCPLLTLRHHAFDGLIWSSATLPMGYILPLLPEGECRCLGRQAICSVCSANPTGPRRQLGSDAMTSSKSVRWNSDLFFDGIAGVSQVQHGAEGTMSNSVANSTIVGVPQNGGPASCTCKNF